MKKGKVILFAMLTVISIVLTACGGTSTTIPTRQEQLQETNLFNLHLLCGVSTEKESSGEFQSGFFLLFGSSNGEITSTSIMVLKLQNQDGRQYFANIPRGMIVLDQNSEQTEPTVKLVFKKSWLKDETSIEYDSDGRLISTDTTEYFQYGNRYEYRTYTAGAIMAPNSFIVPQNLDAVTITYPTTEISSTCWTQIQ